MSLAGTSYMIFVARDLGFTTGVQGVIFATGGIGALAAAMLAPRLGLRLGSGRALALGLALSAAGAALAPMVAAASLFGAALLIAQQVVGDGGHCLHEVHHRTLRQLRAQPEMLARVDAGIRACGQAATLMGALGGGALATAIGARGALLLGAALLAVAAIVALVRLPRD
jgi:predicted MFS family arabinose efflux permease